MFETKSVIVVRDDLMTWQKLNVTSFLTSGLVGASSELIGERYRDASGKTYKSLMIQPMIVLATDANGLTKIHSRASARNVDLAIYIEEMFATGNDVANRAAVEKFDTDDLKLVGVALRDDKKIVDKITKGAKLHP